MQGHTAHPDILLVANPASAGGKTLSRIHDVYDALRNRFPFSVDIHITNALGDARQLVTRQNGEVERQLFIVLGGDGTIQEVANGLMRRSVRYRQRCLLGILSSGTGQGLAQSIGLPPTIRGQLDVLSHMYTQDLDLGVIRRNSTTGRDGALYFVNECQAGIGGEVVRRVESSQAKRHNGRATFGLAALRVAATQPHHAVRVNADGTGSCPHHVLGLVVGNGAFTGGGMNLTPGAVPWDGQLDLLIMGPQSVSRRILNLSHIYSARHINRPEFTLTRVRHLDLSSNEAVQLEADGEYLGQLPATISVVPHAIRIITKEGRG